MVRAVEVALTLSGMLFFALLLGDECYTVLLHCTHCTVLLHCTLSGMLFFALLLGLITDTIESKLDELKQGKNRCSIYHTLCTIQPYTVLTVHYTPYTVLTIHHTLYSPYTIQPHTIHCTPYNHTLYSPYTIHHTTIQPYNHTLYSPYTVHHTPCTTPYTEQDH
jgi:hypothetical protein